MFSGIRGGRARRCSAVIAVLALAAIALPSVARADSRAEAKRYFKKGMEAIGAGDLEKGIAALERAYEARPHPAVLYNIARAYSDMGETAKAISYFERYLESAPDDADRVRKVVAAMRARMVAPVSTGPTATSPPETRPVGVPETVPTSLPAGSPDEIAARLRAIEAGMEELKAIVRGDAGAPLGSPRTAPPPGELLDLEAKTDDFYDLVVVSAARTPSSPPHRPQRHHHHYR